MSSTPFHLPQPFHTDSPSNITSLMQTPPTKLPSLLNKQPSPKITKPPLRNYVSVPEPKLYNLGISPSPSIVPEPMSPAIIPKPRLYNKISMSPSPSIPPVASTVFQYSMLSTLTKPSTSQLPNTSILAQSPKIPILPTANVRTPKLSILSVNKEITPIIPDQINIPTIPSGLSTQKVSTTPSGPKTPNGLSTQKVPITPRGLNTPRASMTPGGAKTSERKRIIHQRTLSLEITPYIQPPMIPNVLDDGESSIEIPKEQKITDYKQQPSVNDDISDSLFLNTAVYINPIDITPKYTITSDSIGNESLKLPLLPLSPAQIPSRLDSEGRGSIEKVESSNLNFTGKLVMPNCGRRRGTNVEQPLRMRATTPIKLPKIALTPKKLMDEDNPWLPPKVEGSTIIRIAAMTPVGKIARVPTTDERPVYIPKISLGVAESVVENNEPDPMLTASIYLDRTNRDYNFVSNKMRTISQNTMNLQKQYKNVLKPLPKITGRITPNKFEEALSIYENNQVYYQDRLDEPDHDVDKISQKLQELENWFIKIAEPKPRDSKEIPEWITREQFKNDHGVTMYCDKELYKYILPKSSSLLVIK